MRGLSQALPAQSCAVLPWHPGAFVRSDPEPLNAPRGVAYSDSSFPRGWKFTMKILNLPSKTAQEHHRQMLVIPAGVRSFPKGTPGLAARLLCFGQREASGQQHTGNTPTFHGKVSNRTSEPCK